MWPILRTFTILLLAFTFSLGNVKAEEDKLTVTASTTMWSTYLVSAGFDLTDRAVLQSDLTIGFSGFYANAWWSTGFDKRFSDGSDDEVDWTIGKAGAFDAFDYDIGIAYFDLVDLGTASGGVGDIIQPYAEFGWSTKLTARQTIRPFFRTEPQFTTNSDYNNGVYLHAGAGHTWQALPYLQVASKLRIVYDSGVLGAESGLISRGDLDLAWRVSDNVTFTMPKFKFTKPISSLDDRDGAHAAFGAGLTVAF